MVVELSHGAQYLPRTAFCVGCTVCVFFNQGYYHNTSNQCMILNLGSFSSIVRCDICQRIRMYRVSQKFLNTYFFSVRASPIGLCPGG